LKTWFGNDSGSTRTEVLRIANAMEHMMQNSRYVYPGAGCEPGVYGYVYPAAGSCTDPTKEGCTRDANGKFVIYLCTVPGNGVYCSVPESEQIETIVHEAAHHGTAFMVDVKPDPYGRETCKKMAINHPEKAITNADSFCYYIYDTASDRTIGGATSSPPASPRTGPTCGGDAGGAPCMFPFTENGVSYTQCTSVGHNQPWCYTTKKGYWGNCNCR
jgi:hypothetical protein